MGKEISISEIVHDKEIPEEIKDLIIPLVSRVKNLERQIVGHIELAYRRGKDTTNSSENL